MRLSDAKKAARESASRSYQEETERDKTLRSGHRLGFMRGVYWQAEQDHLDEPDALKAASARIYELKAETSVLEVMLDRSRNEVAELGAEVWLERERVEQAESELRRSFRRIEELEDENSRLEAQVKSFEPVPSGSYSPKRDWPDDSEINATIEESEDLPEALGNIADKYGADVTGNMERWQDGRFLRHIEDFVGDVIVTCDRFIAGPKVEALKKSYQVLQTLHLATLEAVGIRVDQDPVIKGREIRERVSELEAELAAEAAVKMDSEHYEQENLRLRTERDEFWSRADLAEARITELEAEVEEWKTRAFKSELKLDAEQQFHEKAEAKLAKVRDECEYRITFTNHSGSLLCKHIITILNGDDDGDDD